jgi:fused signal recognition particle receptor
LLVIDGGTGQNGLTQAQEFARAVEVTGLIITKLDGTAKGGIVVSIRKTLPIPVRFIGIGEGINDLQSFDAGAFADALVGL